MGGIWSLTAPLKSGSLLKVLSLRSFIMRTFVSSLLLLSMGCNLVTNFMGPSVKTEPNKPYVIIVMIDGYRSDYTDRFRPPTLLEIRKKGVAAENLIPTYPSDPFSVQYSIATGLYSENHGLMAGTFYDPDKKMVFTKTKRETVRDASWYGGIPFWAAAEKQGVLSAVLFWPGSEAPVGGIRPSYFYYYDDSLSNQARIDQIATWLALPEERRPHLLSIYFTLVDYAGHKFGTESPQVKKSVLELDQLVSRLLTKIKNTSLPVNYLFISPQGMQDLNDKKVEYLEDYINVDRLNIYGDISRWSFYFDDPRDLEKIYSELQQKTHHFKVYKREDLPARLHYSKNRKGGDLVLLVDSPYSIRMSRKSHRETKLKLGDVAGHGYDPFTTLSMRGIFYAMGPQFKEHLQIPEFECVHLYPLLMKLLGLNVLAPIDGDERVLAPILK